MIKNAKNVEKKKIKANFEFVGFENSRLHKILNGKNFPTLNKFCNVDINKYFLLLRKGIYPYEYMDSWERLMKIQYHPKNLFIVN